MKLKERISSTDGQKIHRSAESDSTPIIAQSPVPSSSGQPLESAVLGDMEQRFGFDFSQVRIHSDNEAQQSAQSLSAHAFTIGSDIVFNRGQYQPDTPGGQRLLAHELAHVVQQQGNPQVQTSLEVSSPSDSSELEAERAADAVMNHQNPVLTPAPASVQRFAQGDGEKEHGGHAYMTEQALQNMGLDKDQARQGRFGNWERDLSQALTPGVRSILMEGPAFHALNIIAIKDFGRGINLAEFGTYDPVEHMDNPSGLRASDVFQQGEFSQDRNAVNQNPDQFQNATPAGTASQGYATTDSRYINTPTGTIVLQDGVAPAFNVDESGLPTYMNTSKEWLKRTLRGSASLGRQGEGGRGPREFSSGIHTMQDYYAHSNFCEIAINILIRNGGLQVMNDQNQLQTLNQDQSLDTMVHGNDANGNPVADNLQITGANGQRRDVMTTGSFNLTDTAASILGEVKDKLVEANPFKSKAKGPSALTKAALDYIDMTEPTSFNRTGQMLSSLVRPVTSTIATIGSFEADLVSGAGHAAGGIASAPMQTGGGILRGMSTVNGWLGGDSDYFDGAARRVEGVGDQVSGAVSGIADAGADKIREVTGWLDNYAISLQSREHILSEVYAWASGIDLLKPIKDMARAIPIVGERVAKAIESLQQQIHETIERELGAAYDAAVTKSVAAIDHAIEVLKQKTNVEQQKTAGAGTTFMDGVARTLGGVGDLYQNGQPQAGIAPTGYTPPSHTQIAKDHSDRDQHDHGDQETHHHISAWLNPIAEALATQASTAIGQKVALGWDVVDRGGSISAATLNEIDHEVDEWFKHPSDCQPKWKDFITGQLREVRIGAELLEQLANRRPATPRSNP